MRRKAMIELITICIMVIGTSAMVMAETVGLFYDASVPQIKFTTDDIKIKPILGHS